MPKIKSKNVFDTGLKEPMKPHSHSRYKSNVIAKLTQTEKKMRETNVSPMDPKAFVNLNAKPVTLRVVKSRQSSQP